jgi:lysophospholipase L1-like esterase
MKWWFKPVLWMLLILECAVVGYLGVRIYRVKSTDVLGKATVSVKDKTFNSANPISSLRYYFEPAASQTEQDSDPSSQKNITWTYNADTLNDRFNYTAEKPPKSIRIIALGDSFTFGDHVNTADSWPEQLEDLLNANKVCPNVDTYEVLNLGIRGNDIQYSVERYRLRGAKYNPDLVIWMFIQNDFDEINALLIPRTQEIYKQLENASLLDPESPYKIPDVLSKNEFLLRYDEQTRHILLNGFMKDFNRLYSGPLVYATFPFVSDFYRDWMKQWALERSQSYYLENLPDIYSIPDWSFRDFGDGHPSVKGHAQIAKDIYQYLQSQKILPCKL